MPAEGVARPVVDLDFTATVGLDRGQARALVGAADVGTGAQALQRLTPMTSRITGLAAANELAQALQAPEPSTAEVRAWAGSNITVPGRGKLRPEIWDARRAAQRAHQQAGQEG